MAASRSDDTQLPEPTSEQLASLYAEWPNSWSPLTPTEYFQQRLLGEQAQPTEATEEVHLKQLSQTQLPDGKTLHVG